MTKSELLDALASHPHITRAEAENLVDAYTTRAAHHAPAGAPVSLPDVAMRPLRYEPTTREINALITAASAHPLGLGFLCGGDVRAVAITFGAHAFTVEAARWHLDKGHA